MIYGFSPSENPCLGRGLGPWRRPDWLEKAFSESAKSQVPVILCNYWDHPKGVLLAPKKVLEDSRGGDIAPRVLVLCRCKELVAARNEATEKRAIATWPQVYSQRPAGVLWVRPGLS